MLALFGPCVALRDGKLISNEDEIARALYDAGPEEWIALYDVHV